MKTRKFLFPLFVTMALLLNSCILKSLNPFYVDSAVFFENALIGKWVDHKKGKWEVASVKEEAKDGKGVMKDIFGSEELPKKYENGYFVKYTENNKDVIFFGMPFKINSQLFIDFNLFNFDSDSLNDLVRSNIIETHTLAKVDVLKNGDVSIKWLDDEKLVELFDKNQIQIKHEKVGVNEAMILTASSSELYKFLKKYIESDIKNKWKTDKEYMLSKVNE